MRSMIDYASGLDESGIRSGRDRRIAERLARIETLGQQMMKAQPGGAPAGSASSTERIISGECDSLAEIEKHEEAPKETPMAAKEEIPAESLTEDQRARVRATIAKITDLDVTVIEACDYSPAELVDVFNQATEYHNKIVKGFNDIDNVRRQNSIRTGGTYSNSQTIYEYGVDAVKAQAKLDFYNHSLTRLAQGITTRAVLQSMKSLRP